MGMDATELSRWTRFAAKGGIGKCTAICDCVAESPDDLMFLKDDEITVLMQLPEHEGMYLGHCEGVVGRFHGTHVHFHSKLKKPVMTKRQSSVSVASATSTTKPNSPSPGPSRPASFSRRESERKRESDSLPRRASSRAPSRTLMSVSTDDESSLSFSAASYSSQQQQRHFSEERSMGRVASPLRRPVYVESESEVEVFRDRARQELGRSQMVSPPVVASPPPVSSPPPPMTSPPPMVPPPPMASPPPAVSPPTVSSPPPTTSSFPSPPAHITSFPKPVSPPPRVQSRDAVPPTTHPRPESQTQIQPLQRINTLPLNLHRPTSHTQPTSPLNITKRIPSAQSSPATQTSFSTQQQQQHVPPPLSLPEHETPVKDDVNTAVPSSVYPDTSLSTRFSRFEDDGEVGIGLTMLQNLVDGMESSDEEEEEEWRGGYDAQDGYDAGGGYESAEGRRERDSGQSQRRRERDSAGSGSALGLGYASDDYEDEEEEEEKTVEGGGGFSAAPVSAPVPVPVPVPVPTEPHPQPTPFPTSTTTATTDPPHSPPSPSPFTLPSAPFHERERTNSTYTTSSQGEWDGGADIYDDYRYSRFSMASKMSRFSMATTGSGGRGEVEAPPVPEGTWRKADVEEEGEGEEKGETRRGSVESEASVYSRHSMKDTPSTTTTTTTTITNTTTTTMNRPHPLDLSRSPLLNTTWGSPVSSPGEGSMASAMSTPFVPITGIVQMGVGVPGVSTPVVSAVPAGAGIASGLRHRLEESASPTGTSNKRDSQSVVTRDGDGLGGKIVIEDDEELPSKILDSSDVFESPSPTATPSPVAGGDKEEEGDREKPRNEEGEEEVDGFDESVVATPASLPTPPPTRLAPASPHPLPTLAELREGGLQVPGESKRRSLFLPHPNAPKPPSASSPGPMYIASQQQQQQQARVGMQRPHVVDVMRMALSARPIPARVGRGPTVYGRIEADLSVSIGPVPISFTLDPPPLPVQPPPQVVRPPPSPSPLRSPSMPRSTPPADAESGASTPLRQGSLDTQGTIPRPNFYPKAPGARPRSRSFSGFNSTEVEVPMPLQKSRDDVADAPLAGEVKETLSTPSSLLPTAMPTKASKPSPLRPSPLSLSQTGLGIRVSSGSKSPASPLVPSLSVPPTSPVPSSPAPSVLSHRGLGRISSRSTLDDPSSPSRNILLSRSPLSGADTSSSSSSPNHNLSSSKDSSRPSVDADSLSVHSSHSQLGSPPFDRRPSLRTKLSLPNLRRNRSKQDDTQSLASPGLMDSETLQVKDMDFELVRPSIGRFEAARTSEDSGVLGRDTSIEMRPEIQTGLLRAESPAFSVTSGGGTSLSVPRSPIGDASSANSLVHGGASAPGSRATTDSESSMDAHRQREHKWMTTLSSTPPSQSRKSKKVKKLLLEGVPSSVRYLVWSMLTDGKARVLPKIYSQLGKRGRVPASSDIERDTKLCFKDQPHLHGTEGPVLSLLQAYLSMVPDVQYTRGLTLIAGQLLLLAPEEDAFWIFVSIMDTHIRPYFSSSMTQMEVDSALFSRALESNDSIVAKKVLVDMGVSPSSICAPWFSSLYVGTLPPEYLNRVWDLFLFEGIPFLLRVGLAIMNCCRRQVLGSTSEEALLAFLRNPSPAVLPSTPDAFISLVLSMKLKDDDVRKQRVKMEAQVKRQTQAQAPRIPSSISAISLPRS